MSHYSFSRRHFFYGTLLAGAIPAGGFGSAASLPRLGYKSPNEKLNLACIGAGGQPLSDLRGCETENIVALADVDWKRGEAGFKRYEKAAKYKDFRQMLDKDGKNIDAVIIGTPDHVHATAALWCMERGKHVYVEKPLTRTVWEARLLTQAAAKYKVATQMGNQGYSHEATRVACEIIWSGEIGDVTEIHSWTGRAGWPQGMQKIPPPTPVPATLDWDLWLGGAAYRPYTSGDDEYFKFVHANPTPYTAQQFGFYSPFNWRGFFDFGTGLLGDWGIHIMGPANWALKLGNPTSVECIKKERTSPFTYPDRCVIKYEFGARGNMPPVTLYWHDNVAGDAYTPPGMTAEQMRPIAGGGPAIGPARGGSAGRSGGGPGTRGGAPQQRGSGYNQIFAGTQGYLGTRGRGEGVGLLPGSRWAEYKLPPQLLTRSPGHQRDWLRACKGGDPACSNFSVAGPYAEWVVLGAIAVHFEGKLEWDAARMRFTNNSAANEFVKPKFRKGWSIKL
jgi:predicted dehydrogenase